MMNSLQQSRNSVRFDDRVMTTRILDIAVVGC